MIEGGRLVECSCMRGILKVYITTVNSTLHSNIHIYKMLESHNCDQRCQHQHAHAMFTKFGLAFFPCSHAPRSHAHWRLVLVCHVNGPLIMSEEIQAYMTRNVYGLFPTNLPPSITTLGHVTLYKTYIHTWDYVHSIPYHNPRPSHWLILTQQLKSPSEHHFSQHNDKVAIEVPCISG